MLKLVNKPKLANRGKGGRGGQRMAKEGKGGQRRAKEGKGGQKGQRLKGQRQIVQINRKFG